MIGCILVFILVIFSELNVIKIRHNKIKNSGKLIEIYNHEKREKIYNYFLSCWVIVFILIIMIIFSRNILIESIVLILAPIVLILFFKNRMSDIHIYENAIVINGMYVPWHHIESVKEEESKTIIIKIKKGSGTPLLEIKSKGINQVHKLKENIIKNIQIYHRGINS